MDANELDAFLDRIGVEKPNHFYRVDLFPKGDAIYPYRMYYSKDGVRVCESGIMNLSKHECVGVPTITPV